MINLSTLLVEGLNLTFDSSITDENKINAKKALYLFASKESNDINIDRTGMLDRFDFHLKSVDKHWSDIVYSFEFYSKGGKLQNKKPYNDAPYEKRAAVYRTIKNAIDDIQNDETSVYRGMSFEEFLVSKKRGYFKSNGLYNIGDSQKDYTFFGKDFSTAKFYAADFQPLESSMTRKKPGVIIEIPKNLTKSAVDVKNQYGHNVGTDGEYITKENIPYNIIKAIYLVIPEVSFAGTLDIIYNIHRQKYTSGSRSHPTVDYKIIKYLK